MKDIPDPVVKNVGLGWLADVARTTGLAFAKALEGPLMIRPAMGMIRIDVASKMADAGDRNGAKKELDTVRIVLSQINTASTGRFPLARAYRTAGGPDDSDSVLAEAMRPVH